MGPDPLPLPSWKIPFHVEFFFEVIIIFLSEKKLSKFKYKFTYFIDPGY